MVSLNKSCWSCTRIVSRIVQQSFLIKGLTATPKDNMATKGEQRSILKVNVNKETKKG
jgi:hypothetical protein